MPKTVVVSSAQKSAAQAMVRRSAITGRQVSDSVRKIANAKVQPGARKHESTVRSTKAVTRAQRNQ